MSYHHPVDAEQKPPVRRSGRLGLRMERQVLRLTSPNASRRARLWLAAANGRALPRPSIAPIDGPEVLMTVRFEGLSESEQKTALAAFPGGKRFVLAS